jgi:predicted RNA-binding protein with PIN domain
MQKYLIDGNNVIGKNPKLFQIQSKDKQASRNLLVFLVGRYLANKKQSAIIFFDGFPGEAIPFFKGKIVYSEKSTADEKIKSEITGTNNRRNLTVVSSDNEIINFAKVCGCSVLPSEEFLKKANKEKRTDEEKTKIEEMNKDAEEFKKLFGVKDKKP